MDCNTRPSSGRNSLCRDWPRSKTYLDSTKPHIYKPIQILHGIDKIFCIYPKGIYFDSWTYWSYPKQRCKGCWENLQHYQTIHFFFEMQLILNKFLPPSLSVKIYTCFIPVIIWNQSLLLHQSTVDWTPTVCQTLCWALCMPGHPQGRHYYKKLLFREVQYKGRIWISLSPSLWQYVPLKNK